MDQKMRFGLIGTGGIAQTWVQAFEQSTTARLVAVADVRPEAAKATAERIGGPAFDSYLALSKEAAVDAVVIATPPSTHPEIAVHFLEKKVHVLCEKPFCIDGASARRMVEASRKSGATLTMASKFRYVEDCVKARSIVASGILGDVVLFENSFTAYVDMTKRWNSDPKLSGGGVLIDNGTHSIDIMRYFLGPITEVQVVEGKRIQGLPVEDTVHVFARSAGGAMGSIDLSWSINKELDRYISIHGSKGTIVVGWKESKYRPSSSRDWVVFGKGYDKFQAFRSQIDNFTGSIHGRESLLITHEDALASVEVIEAAHRSLGQNAWVPVNGAAAGSR
jgi:predicted dehydrogenase